MAAKVLLSASHQIMLFQKRKVGFNVRELWQYLVLELKQIPEL